MKPKIFVITVNFNNGAITSECLQSFAKVDKKEIDLSLIVVDNGSTEEASMKLEKNTPNVTFLYSPKNLGFAGGNNIGIKYALKNKADYVLLINNDATIVENSFFTNLLNSKGDIVSPLVRYQSDGESTLDYGGKIDYLFGRNTHLHSNPNITPDYFSGVCLFIKSKIFSKIGGLDDGFFLYYEDTDFCLRAIKAGFKLGFCQGSSIFHNLSTSANKFGKRKITILANSHLRFCTRHLPLTSAPFYLAFNLYLRFKTLFL